MKIAWIVAAGCLVASPALAQDAFGDLDAAYLRGEYAQVQQVGQRALNDPARANERDRVWYLVGMAALQQRQEDQAQEAFQRVLNDFPQSRWRVEAEVALGDAQWMAGDVATAMRTYQSAVAHAEPAGSVRAYFQLGQAARAAGQWEMARTALQTVETRWPSSFEAADARQTLKNSDFSFSIQVGAFGVRENAVRLQKELARRGYTTILDRNLADGRVVYRVKTGRFSTREEAVQMAARLKDDGFPGKVVP